MNINIWQNKEIGRGWFWSYVDNTYPIDYCFTKIGAMRAIKKWAKQKDIVDYKIVERI